MSLYLYKNDQQVGPYDESTIREWLQNGQISLNDSGIREGMSEWQPLSQLLGMQSALPSLPTGRFQNELRLLEQYKADIQQFGETVSQADPQTQKKLQRQLDQKLQIYAKQIQLVQTQFPDQDEGKFHESVYYTFQALAKMFHSGVMRRMAVRSRGYGNHNMAIATGLIARQQEKNNARQALNTLDKAINIYDYAGARLLKAEILYRLGQKPQAITELDYIIANFQDDEVYIEARQLKDEILNPPKKGMCFVATAAYGSPLAPEVVLFSRFRDEVLLHFLLGRAFVRFYYFASPPLAAVIAKTEFLRTATRRLLLAPVLHLLKLAKFNS